MTEKRYKEVSEFDDDLIHITCPKCKYPMRVLAKDNKGIYQCYCASCGLDRFMKDTLDEDNLTFKEFNRCVERGKAIDIERLFDFIYEQHELIEYLKPLANENTQYIADIEDDIATFKEEIKELTDALNQRTQQLDDYGLKVQETLQEAYNQNARHSNPIALGVCLMIKNIAKELGVELK